jgi:hypothetical protein
MMLTDLQNMKNPFSSHGSRTQITVFSLAIEAGQEEQQHGSRTILQRVVALIGEGSYLRKHLRLLPPWKQAIRHRREPDGTTPKHRTKEVPKQSTPTPVSQSASPTPCRHGRPVERRASDRQCVVVEQHNWLEEKCADEENSNFSGRHDLRK